MKKRSRRHRGIIFLLIVVTLILALFSRDVYKLLFYPKKYINIIESAAKKYNVDPYLIFSVIKIESNFDKNAISKAEAKGLMQVIESTAIEQSRGIATIDKDNIDFFDPYTNIEIGTKYFSNLIKRYDGNIYLAICAYNAGLGNIDKWFKQPYNQYTDFETTIDLVKFEETKMYLSKVIDAYNSYKTLYNE